VDSGVILRSAQYRRSQLSQVALLYCFRFPLAIPVGTTIAKIEAVLSESLIPYRERTDVPRRIAIEAC
jgi:hypothetical protein